MFHSPGGLADAGRDGQNSMDERDLHVPVTLGAAVRRVRLDKLDHTEAVEPRRGVLIADELEG